MMSKDYNQILPEGSLASPNWLDQRVLFYTLFVIGGFLLTWTLCKLLIPVLKKLKFGQEVRLEGNPDHLKKQGTPTMGGLAFLAVYIIGLIVLLLIRSDSYFLSELLPLSVLVIGFGIVGALDDWLKIKKKQSEGLKAYQKFGLQILIAVIVTLHFYFSGRIGTYVTIPFAQGERMDLGWFFIPFVIFVIVGTDNAVNLTDGLDGLVSMVSLPVLAVLILFGTALSNHWMNLPIALFIGILLGFLMVNAHPAKLFMGDTGSLMLGGFIAGISVIYRVEWFLLIFGFIYFAETLSVILQVSYYKITHGKRIFKMSPIHHHFERTGHTEIQIATAFTAVTILLCFLAYCAYLP